MYTVIKITIASYLVICMVFIIRKVHQLHYRLDILYSFPFTKKIRILMKTIDITFLLKCL